METEGFFGGGDKCFILIYLIYFFDNTNTIEFNIVDT